MAGAWGWLTTFNTGTAVAIADGITKRVPVSESPTGETGDVVNRMQGLHNGTIIDYDGTSAGDIAPGIFSQVVMVTTAADTYYDAASAYIGKSGTVTKTKWASGQETCTARLLSIEPLGRSLPGKGIGYFLWTFQGKTNWA